MQIISNNGEFVILQVKEQSSVSFQCLKLKKVQERNIRYQID